jgi:hypothetical protein
MAENHDLTLLAFDRDAATGDRFRSTLTKLPNSETS